MNKELTPLEALEDLISFIGVGEIANTAELCEYILKRKDIIETALKEKVNIEEELGIDLITLFKALKDGIHKKDYLDCCYDCKLRFMKGEWYLAQPFDENYSHIVKTKDYDKTWALTKEELL